MNTIGLKNFVLKYRLYHIPFWLGYHLIWLTFNIGSLSEVQDYLFFSTSSIKFYFYVAFQVMGVYFNLYYLIPKLLYVGRNVAYIASVLATILVCAGCICSGYYLIAHFSDQTFFELFERPPDKFLSLFLTATLPSTAATMTLAMSVKLGKNWLETEKGRNRLEKENLETELKYLKSQINPHFLFNTINSIFALIHKNPDLASESLANFSDMLRYQLYDCNDEKIELDKELKFLENFIDLEKLRLNQESTEIQFHIQDKTTQKQCIAPFILIPFIENAFKHVSKGKGQKNCIRMDLLVDDMGLQLKIENSTNKSQSLKKGEDDSSGIGLKNVKRRLNLIYNEQHFLEFDEGKNKFLVNLKIEWQKN